MPVSKEMVDAVRKARWEEWERMAEKTPRGRHILSVELLRTQHNETAVVLTVAHNGRVVQYELRGDARGGNPRPVISRQRVLDVCRSPGYEQTMPHLLAFIERAAGDLGDGEAVTESLPLGEPPPKESPQPGVVALGSSLLTTTFNLGEEAIEP